MQPCRDLTKWGAGSSIQPPGAKENSLDIETQPWETQAAALLLTASTDTAEKKSPGKIYDRRAV